MAWNRIIDFTASLESTTSVEERKFMTVYIGIDQHDILFDNEDAGTKLASIFTSIQVQVSSHRLKSSFRHKICHIWGHLAACSVADWLRLVCPPRRRRHPRGAWMEGRDRVDLLFDSRSKQAPLWLRLSVL